MRFIRKYFSIFMYLFFGLLTTLVNISVYYFCFMKMNISNVTSTIIAWIISVIFAFITNKKFVFFSGKWDGYTVFNESVKFCLCRVGTGVMEVIIMYVSVNLLHYDGMKMKVITNIVIVILNYIASKLLIFKH